jgi:hypothetical protein
MLDGTHTRAAIVKVVVDEFDVSEHDAQKDLDGFLSELNTEGMLADE